MEYKCLICGQFFDYEGDDEPECPICSKNGDPVTFREYMDLPKEVRHMIEDGVPVYTELPDFVKEALAEADGYENDEDVFDDEDK